MPRDEGGVDQALNSCLMMTTTIQVQSQTRPCGLSRRVFEAQLGSPGAQGTRMRAASHSVYEEARGIHHLSLEVREALDDAPYSTRVASG